MRSNNWRILILIVQASCFGCNETVPSQDVLNHDEILVEAAAADCSLNRTEDASACPQCPAPIVKPSPALPQVIAELPSEVYPQYKITLLPRIATVQGDLPEFAVSLDALSDDPSAVLVGGWTGSDWWTQTVGTPWSPSGGIFVARATHSRWYVYSYQSPHRVTVEGKSAHVEDMSTLGLVGQLASWNLNAAAERKAGGVLLAFMTGLDNGKTQLYLDLVITDAADKVLHRWFAKDLPEVSGPLALSEMHDESIVVGTRFATSVGSKHSNLALWRTNSQAVLIGQKVHAGPNVARVNTIEPAPNNGIYVCWRQYPANGPLPDNYVTMVSRYDANFEQLWTTTHPPDYGNNQASFHVHDDRVSLIQSLKPHNLVSIYTRNADGEVHLSQAIGPTPWLDTIGDIYVPPSGPPLLIIASNKIWAWPLPSLTESYP